MAEFYGGLPPAEELATAGALSGCPPIRPRMIGDRIFDDPVLVGFALGRSVYVLAAG